MKLLLVLALSVAAVFIVPVSSSASTTTTAAAGYGGERTEVQIQNDDNVKTPDSTTTTTESYYCPQAFSSNNIWNDITFAVHRNGDTEHCASVPSSTTALQTTLSKYTNPSSCREETLDKYQVESFLTEFLSTTRGCGPVPHLNANVEVPDDDPASSLLEFCDMGPDHTVIQKDHSSLIPVATSGTLPCRFYTREGWRITSLTQLAELAVNTTTTTTTQEECTVGVDGEEETCVSSNNKDSHVLHLYAVPAGRMFMFAPSYVGEQFVLNHVRDTAGNVVTLQVLSLQPRVFDIYNFFNLDESNQLMDKALGETSETHRFHRSTTGTTGASVFSKRTSENAWDTHGETAMKVKQRCFSLLGIDEYHEELADGLQILRYNQTKAYTAHMDYLDNPASESYDYDSSGKGANRFATILLYFTELAEHEGGETVFPRAWPPHLAEDERVDFVDGLQQLRDSGDAAMLEPGSWEETMTVQCRTHLIVRPKAARAVLFYSQ
jgi:2OG-Fe(II) oxygenase superfamily